MGEKKVFLPFLEILQKSRWGDWDDWDDSNERFISPTEMKWLELRSSGPGLFKPELSPSFIIWAQGELNCKLLIFELYWSLVEFSLLVFSRRISAKQWGRLMKNDSWRWKRPKRHGKSSVKYIKIVQGPAQGNGLFLLVLGAGSWRPNPGSVQI